MLGIMNILLAISGLIWIADFFIHLTFFSIDETEQYALLNRMFGPYWWAFWINFIGTILVPQLFWLQKYRKRIWFSIIVALAFQLERVLIFLTSFLRDYLPSSWSMIYDYSFGYSAAYAILVTIIYLLKERFNKIAL
jgi:molybdopterin-containing oxidoreductase family membrane subunit